MTTRRKFIIGSSSICLPVAFSAQAQNFPDHPIRLIVSYLPGGTSDYFARLITNSTPMKINNQTVIVDNRPGGGTIIGTQAVFNSKPDGYTIGMIDAQFHLNALLRPELPYTPNDFSYVANIGEQPMILIVPSDPGNQTLPDFVKRIQKSDRVSYGVWGIGAINHLAGLDFCDSLGLKTAVAAPYPGGGTMPQAVATNEIDFAFVDAASADPLIDSGKIKAIAHSSNVPGINVRNLPPVAEIISGFHYVPSMGIIAPKDTSADRIKTISEAIKMAMETKTVIQGFDSKMVKPNWLSSDEYRTYIQETIESYQKIIRKFNIKLK